MRKLWLTFTAMLLCSIASFAQFGGGTGTQNNPYLISEPAHFKAIATQQSTSGKYFKLTTNLNLGTYDASDSFVIANFAGTFDGNNHTITYQGSFTANSEGQKVGLFQTNSGTIKNLNLDANITVGGSGQKVKVALLCGENNGTIELCDVVGNINSTAKSNSTGNASVGLIIGNNKKTLRYCTGYGNVTGVGYVGGLVGSMGTILEGSSQGYIKGCYFTGNVTANNSSSIKYEGLDLQSFGGGICGFALSPAKIELCVAEAVIVAGANVGGVSTTGYAISVWNYSTVNNNYCTGTVIKNGVSSAIDSNDEIVDVAFKITIFGSTPPEYDENNYCSETPASVVQALNQAKNDNNFYFKVINGKVVLIVGQQQEEEEIICEAPTGFTVVKNNDNTFTASWSANGEGANTSFTESTFILTVTGGDLTQTMETTIQDASTNAFSITSEYPLSASENPYVFTIKSKCDENVFSVPQQVSFYVDPGCVANVNLSNVTTTSAKITWQGNVSAVTLGNNTYNISEGQTEYTFNNLTPATTYTAQVIFNCIRHNEQNEEEPYTRTLTVDFETMGATFITKQNGNFNDPNTWLGNKVPEGAVANITINTGHRVIVNHDLKITDTYKIVENKGILQITQNGQLINNSNVNVPGIVEIVSANKNNGEWTFIGAPFTDNYKLGTIYPMSHDISVSKYDYSTANWSESWAHVGTQMEAGEGYFAWPFYSGAVIFTTYGDVWNYTEGRVGEYDFNRDTTATKLNNANVITITKENLQGDANTGRWMALSNPYPAKLSVSKFATANNIQGGGIYRLTCSTVIETETVNGQEVEKEVQNYEFVPLEGNIAMTEGFFVNLPSGNSVTFAKNQLTANNQAKSQVAPREFVELSLVKGNYNSKLYFAHNQEAEQNYDIFDANKLFALGEVAEPYFVTDGIALVKEEVAELPYYATMNVRSFADDTVSFVVNNIPEGLAVSIIDGEEVIDMIEGGVYTTEILTGENADRFKVLIKKSVSISDVEELEVNITNDNRHINIETTETDLQVEVYNALGQKVLSTKDRNFTLNQVSAGAYLIKAFNNKASKTQKIVVE